MANETIVLIVLVILVAGALPAWPYSRSWGYAPTGLLAAVLIALLVWMMLGGRMPGSSTGENIKADVREAGSNLKAAGRDMADSIRDTVK